jgi:hypothetical protein
VCVCSRSVRNLGCPHFKCGSCRKTLFANLRYLFANLRYLLTKNVKHVALFADVWPYKTPLLQLFIPSPQNQWSALRLRIESSKLIRSSRQNCKIGMICTFHQVRQWAAGFHHHLFFRPDKLHNIHRCRLPYSDNHNLKYGYIIEQLNHHLDNVVYHIFI